jgi:hypothetical protein
MLKHVKVGVGLTNDIRGTEFTTLLIDSSVRHQHLYGCSYNPIFTNRAFAKLQLQVVRSEGIIYSSASNLTTFNSFISQYENGEAATVPRSAPILVENILDILGMGARCPSIRNFTLFHHQ